MAPGILCAARHVAPSASGSSNNGSSHSSKQKVEEKPSQFVTSNSIRPPSSMQIVNAATSCLSTVVSHLASHRNHHHDHFEMVMAPRPKQVTDPLNEMVRARLCGDNYLETTNYGSSGSEHDPDSVCLADMVYGFMEEEDEGGMENNEVGNCGRSRCNCLNGTGEPCSDNKAEVESVDGDSNSGIPEDDFNEFFSADLKEILEGLFSSSINNPVEFLLHKEAVRALEINQNEVENPNANKQEIIDQRSWLRRSVMNYLRGLGYNAGICKSRWEHIGGFPAGNYEYIDVIIDGERFFVDIDFRVQFEIARPTTVFDALLRVLPNVYVGKAERLKQVIKIMCDSSKKSLKKMGMHLPPWRKYRYMQAKWFGPYKRTTNAVTSSSPDTYSNDSSLARELGSIALKGTGWDHRFKHQMELTMHFEKGYSRLKLRPNSADEIIVVGTDWTPPVLTPRPVSHAKISGLACALSEAGLTCSLGSQKAPQKQQRE